MFSKLLLFAVLLNFLSKSNVACEDEDDNENPRDLRSIFAPFETLLANIKNLFHTKTEIIQEKKERLKSAIDVFFEEINRKKETIQPGKAQDEQENEIETRLRFKNILLKRPNKTFEVSPEMSAEQLITTHGYKSESHTVLTADGYMITMQRVLREYGQLNERVVILHHGLLGSSEDWLLLGEQRALPYMLNENGFDVWLLNARGNRYSRIHTRKSPERIDFWDFSWHEMGVYDLPAAIKYISEITNNAELNFIGHSMGGTALLVLLSTFPEYNYLLRSGILLAPLAFMYHAKGPIRMLADFYRTNGYNSLNFLGQTEYMHTEAFPDQIIDKYCKGDDRSCLNPLLLLGNGGSLTLHPELMENVLAHSPAGGSVKTVMHYVQLVKSGYFQMFDYGATNNYRKYKNATPEMYNLRRINLPLALFSSPSDWLATVPDIQTMLPLLQHVKIHHVVKSDNFGHFDFVWNQDAPELVFNFILSLLEQMLPKRDPFYQH